MRTRRLDCITTGSGITIRGLVITFSQDPIGLAGNNPTLYAFVKKINTEVDIFGLSATHGHHSDPKFMGGDPKQALTNMESTDHIDLHRDMNVFLESKTKVNQ